MTDFAIEVACDWCRNRVVSFVGPPAMVEVTHAVDHNERRSVDRICLHCYTEFLRWVAARHNEPV